MDFETLRADLIGTDAVIVTPFGRRRVTYADYVASGRALRSVEERMARLALPLYANTHSEDSATGAHSTHLSHQAAAYVKAQLGGDQTCKLVFCGSGSTAAVRRMQDILGLTVPHAHREAVLAALPERDRPVVFVGPYEHHSNEVSWRETIAEVIEVPLCPRGNLDLDALVRRLKDPALAGRPKIGSFSAASNVTGLLTDTRTIARVLHAHGAFAFFDFAASAPYVQIDMKPGQPDGYDAVFLSPHKFVGGPGTPGLLCFQAHLYHLAVPSVPGGGTVQYVSRTRHDFVDDIEAREDAGTPAILGKLRTALAFHVKEQLGVERLTAREHELYARACARLGPNPRVQLLGNPQASRLAFLSFLIRPDGEDRFLHPRLVVRLLNDLFGIQARGGCACAGPYGHALLAIDDARSVRYEQCILGNLNGLKPGWTRLNLAPWATDEEVEFLLAATEFIAAYGERFLPLYTLDWHSGAWSHPQDGAPADLFGETFPEREEGPVPYADYLAQAQALATTLEVGEGRPLPEGVPQDLVFFTY
ncbi:aminotransferase class V-fold PLP-dependent enzyme [Deinococcus metallilatus]|uniref:Aminotransferase class V-fold PLP-dependent enzyme n=1 Tax=Deinococcus metallilatus TaxID=1211322 RepID=A0AAJ5F5Q2_9DEIO|nr:aminotransferase class V-fold PLP-dependent enzyme [Deinococcus metallilatus]MBB5294450.1 selenocysteine lyase/cysteine desulfurase [Deinococcus metallilatus]QBY10195.1 aminotransferase class V-fold PLP-dependent enzyme [Deinococcus metallilatus]RXJ13921.1 aminotransferase class V-fold PLP-dependent enzyme [Deinococcus metallilatus]TLK29886.1 aminotransferase class V-fold PLP-dependent enzyme [Deinococcus metallilatus]GMA15666.1 aminotransferase [Deinococcus metallilatus]